MGVCVCLCVCVRVYALSRSISFEYSKPCSVFAFGLFEMCSTMHGAIHVQTYDEHYFESLAWNQDLMVMTWGQT